MERPKDTKNQIINVAEALCAEVGPHEVRHNEVAARVGIKPPSLYAHFDSFESILAAVARRGLEITLETYSDIDDFDSAVEALNVTQARQIDILAAHPGFARLVLADLSLPGGPHAIEANIELVEELKALEHELFDRAVSQGQIEVADFPLWLAQRLGSLYVTMSMEWSTNPVIPSTRLEEIKEFLAIKTT